jgi:hypothetical protein
MPVITITVD